MLGRDVQLGVSGLIVVGEEPEPRLSRTLRSCRGRRTVAQRRCSLVRSRGQALAPWRQRETWARHRPERRDAAARRGAGDIGRSWREAGARALASQHLSAGFRFSPDGLAASLVRVRCSLVTATLTIVVDDGLAERLWRECAARSPRAIHKVHVDEVTHGGSNLAPPARRFGASTGAVWLATERGRCRRPGQAWPARQPRRIWGRTSWGRPAPPASLPSLPPSLLFCSLDHTRPSLAPCAHQ